MSAGDQGDGNVQLARMAGEVGLHGEGVTELYELVHVVGVGVEHLDSPSAACPSASSRLALYQW